MDNKATPETKTVRKRRTPQELRAHHLDQAANLQKREEARIAVEVGEIVSRLLSLQDSATAATIPSIASACKQAAAILSPHTRKADPK